MRLRSLMATACAVGVAGCGVVYTSPGVEPVAPGSPAAEELGYSVSVLPMTLDVVASANQASVGRSFVQLPDAYDTNTVARRFAAAGTAPPPAAAANAAALATPAPATAAASSQPAPTRLPPETAPRPYRIGVGDVIAIGAGDATAAANITRETFTVQDNGVISLPGVGQIEVGGLTVDNARDNVLRALVASGADPAFSFELEEFNSQSVVVGGAVAQPTVLPITFRPLFLSEALQQAGGIAFEDVSEATVEIARDGEVYTVPAREIQSGQIAPIALRDGDNIFVDVGLTEAARQRAFDEQLRLVQLEADAVRARAETTRLQADQARLATDSITAVQNTFDRRVELGAETAGFAYLTGEVSNPLRFPLPFEGTANLADVMHFDRFGNIIFSDFGEIYVLRGEMETVPAAITAYHLDASNVAAMVLATRFVMQPNDIVFVAEQPVTAWNRVISQILPNQAVGAANAINNID